MKILLMEKFDGISSQIPIEMGRDPRFRFTSTGRYPSYVKWGVNSNGLYVSNNRTSVYDGDQIISLFLDMLTGLQVGERYSVIMNGLRLGKYLSYGNSYLTINSYTLQELSLAGVLMYSTGATLSSQLPNNPLNLLANIDYNVEVVIDVISSSQASYKFYVNGSLTYSVTSSRSNTLIHHRMGSYYSNNSSYHIATPTMSLKEILVLHLDAGESRVGNVRLERLTVESVSEHLASPENVTVVNLANSTYSELGEDEVEFTFSKPTLGKNETVIGVDHRVAGLATANGSKMKVKAMDGEDEIHSVVEVLPLSQTRKSGCMVQPAIHLDDSYDSVKLVLSTTED